MAPEAGGGKRIFDPKVLAGFDFASLRSLRKRIPISQILPPVITLFNGFCATFCANSLSGETESESAAIREFKEDVTQVLIEIREQIQGHIDDLTEQIEVLRVAIDDARAEFEWAVRLATRAEQKFNVEEPAKTSLFD